MSRNLRSGLRQSLKPSIAGGLGVNDIFTTASLDLNFAKYKNLGRLVEHTRASSGTYVGSDGLIKDAVTNIVLYSEDYSSGNWGTTSTANLSLENILAPDGTLGVFKVVPGNGLSYRVLRSGGILLPDNAVVTLSCYFKPAEWNSIKIAVRDKAASYKGVIFNYDTQNFSGADSEAIDYGFEQQSNGFIRVWVTIDDVSSGSYAPEFTIYPLNDSTLPTTGDGTSGVYIWGAQLEESSTVGEYVKTTSTINSAPRFDHNPTTGESLGLLVEESRENLLQRSEEFDQSPWSAVRSAIASNVVTSPNGSVTADKLIASTDPSTSHYVRQSVSLSASQVYNFTVYAKAAEYGYLNITTYGSNGWSATTTSYFDLVNGVVTPSTTGIASIADVGNGWYRINHQATKNATSGYSNIDIYVTNSGSSATFTGDGTSGIYIWGAQLEEGSFPTSYIPTEGSTVTRSPDITSIEGNNFGTFNLLQYSEEFGQTTGPVRGIITPNALTAPDGTLTADKLEKTESGATYTYVSQSFTQNTAYSFSVYAKVGNTGKIRFNDFSTNNSITFNIAAEITESVGTDWSNPNIEDAGNGWYRVSAIFTPTTTGSRNVSYAYINTANSGDYVYFWGAQLEQSSTATPYVKSDVTWQSRASNATYYDSTGTLKKSSQNLLLGSESMETGLWSKINLAGFGSGSIANAIAAPDGTITADKITADTSNANHFVRQIETFLANTTYTISVYAKAAEQSILRLSCQVSGSGNARIYVNLSDQQRTTAFSNWAILNSSVTPVGNNWYRCELAFTVSSTGGAGYIDIGGTTASGVDSYVGNNTDGIYLWGAQLEKGPYAGDYVKTEGSAASSARNVAFLPDGNGNFVSAGELLLEDAATNLVESSEDFSSYWTVTDSTITTSQTEAPDGTLTATKIEIANNTSSKVNSTSSFAANTYTFSFWVKAVGNNTGTWGVNWYSSVDGQNKQTVPVTTDWVRHSITFTSTGNTFVYVADNRDSLASLTEALVWGAQLEANPYATSYIPTYGSEATRAADVSSSSSGFGNSWYRQDEGTVFADAASSQSTASSNVAMIINDGTLSNRLELDVIAGSLGGAGRATFVSGGSVSFDTGNSASPAFSTNIFYRQAASYKLNDFAYALNGGSIQTDTSGLVPVAPDRVEIGARLVTTNLLNGTIRRLTYWPKRLPDFTLQTITQ